MKAEETLPDAMLEDTKSLLPPHILVLTMDSGHMAFLYAIQMGAVVQFIMSTRRIGGKGVHPKHLGKSLAVDPRWVSVGPSTSCSLALYLTYVYTSSRCLAVTAYQDNFRMFALHEPPELESQLQAGVSLNPIKEVCYSENSKHDPG